MSKKYIDKKAFNKKIKNLEVEISELKKYNIDKSNKINDLSKSINKNNK